MFEINLTLTQENVELAIQQYLTSQGLNFKTCSIEFIAGRKGKGLVTNVTLKPTAVTAVPAASSAPSLVTALDEPTSCEELDEVQSINESEEELLEASEEAVPVPKKTLFGGTSA